MKEESIIEFHQGNKSLGEHRPIMVLVAESTDVDNPFVEHHIFTGWQKLPYISRRTWGSRYSRELLALPDIFTAEAMIKAERQLAQDHFAFRIHEQDNAMAMAFFWNGSLFEFVPTNGGPLPLLWQRLLGKYKAEINQMFEATRSPKLEEFRTRFAAAGRLQVTIEALDSKR